MTCLRCDSNQGRGCPECDGTLDEPIPRYPLMGMLSLAIIAVCLMAVVAAVKGWL